MQNNKGFSLLEAIVVIAIMGVLAAGVIVGVGALSGWRVTETASDIDSALKATRIEAMSKSSAYLEISVDSNGDYFMKEKQGDAEKIGSNKVTISYTTNRGVDVDITDGNPLIISYNRSAGSFMPIITSVENDGTFNFMSDPAGEIYCSKIVITNGRKTKTITLVKDTGKHTLR